MFDEFMKNMDGYKTKLQLLAMMILGTGAEYWAWNIPEFVYMVLGLGAAATAKHKMDAIYASLKKK